MPQDDKKQGLLGQLMSSLGLKKAAPPPPPSAPRPRTTAPKKAGSEQFIRSTNDTKPLDGKTTNPLSPHEKAKQSEERRYLIAAYEATPTLIPEFQNPQYMYKLISNEREYTQERLNELLQQRKDILVQHGEVVPPELESMVEELERQIQEQRNELTRLFLLIKRVAGIQKSGTGGTDFLDPLKA